MRNLICSIGVLLVLSAGIGVSQSTPPSSDGTPTAKCTQQCEAAFDKCMKSKMKKNFNISTEDQLKCQKKVLDCRSACPTAK